MEIMKNQISKVLGNNIKKIRKKRGIKQEELAELIGLEVKSLSLIETGAGFASAKTLEKLANILKISFAQLFEEENSKTAETLYSAALLNLELIKNNSKKLETINLVLQSLV